MHFKGFIYLPTRTPHGTWFYSGMELQIQPLKKKNMRWLLQGGAHQIPNHSIQNEDLPTCGKKKKCSVVLNSSFLLAKMCFLLKAQLKLPCY